jgi:hypothetical protein
MSALEQNFNPNPLEASKREGLGKDRREGGRVCKVVTNICVCVCVLLGYPKLLSGDYTNIAGLQNTKYKAIYPHATENQQEVDQFRRYYLSMPFYPFRTLCPRDLSNFHLTRSNEFNASSPIYPANTQIDITLKKRNVTNFLNYMLPYNLPPDTGTNTETLSEAQRRACCSFNLRNAAGNQITYDISAVNIILNDLYMPVSVCCAVYALSPCTHTHT